MRSLKFSIVLCAIVFSSFAMGQADMASIPRSSSTAKIESFNFFNWKRNLKMSYFGDYTATTLKKWDDNTYNSSGERTSLPVSLLNEINTTYKFYDKWSLFTKTVFYYQIGDRNDLRDTDDQNVLSVGDPMVGIMYDILKTKTLIYNGRITHKQPLSKYSKTTGVNSEIEYRNFFIWFPTYTSTFLLWNTYRYYAYESDINSERFRINNRLIYNYSFTDRWGMQLMSEWVLQHRAPKEGAGTRKWNHFEKYRNTFSVGATYKIFNRNLTLIPNIEAQDNQNIKWETLQFGVTLLGKIF
jgi:hypothetical protein